MALFPLPQSSSLQAFELALVLLKVPPVLPDSQFLLPQFLVSLTNAPCWAPHSSSLSSSFKVRSPRFSRPMSDPSFFFKSNLLIFGCTGSSLGHMGFLLVAASKRYSALQSGGSFTRKATTMRTRAPQPESSPCSPQLEKSPRSNEDPA